MPDQYNPPPGPPPSWRPHHDETHAAPVGPPPSYRPQQESYAPPAGPPPSWAARQEPEPFQPPPGPPPGRFQDKDEHGTEEQAPPYHDWTVIPDTSLLPPPPPLSNDVSPTANASEEEGAAADQWGRDNPLWAARQLPPAQLRAMRDSAHTLLRPQNFTGEVLPKPNARPGTWYVRSRAGTRDSCLQTSLPLYSAIHDAPQVTGRANTAYFELRLLSAGDGGSRARHRTLEAAEAGVAVGFFAPPYMGWRLPGWQRGSLAVHGDDGRRYVNDPFGGVDFTAPFAPGETLGIGMTWKPLRSGAPPTYGAGRQQSPLAVDVFLTRDGRRDGGWDLREEMDSERILGGTIGLDGDHDIFAAVGLFGAVELEVRFNPQDWLYRPTGM